MKMENCSYFKNIDVAYFGLLSAVGMNWVEICCRSMATLDSSPTKVWGSFGHSKGPENSGLFLLFYFCGCLPRTLMEGLVYPQVQTVVACWSDFVISESESRRVPCVRYRTSSTKSARMVSFQTAAWNLASIFTITRVWSIETTHLTCLCQSFIH